MCKREMPLIIFASSQVVKMARLATDKIKFNARA